MNFTSGDNTEEFSPEMLLQSIEKETNRVRIEEDEMTAWLYIAPKQDGTDYTREELIEFLRVNGVTEGYHRSNLAAMAKKHVYYREVIAARAILPAEGQDGHFEYSVSTEDYSRHPKINEDGSVDYSSMSLLQNVSKGEKLARYIPALPGEDGITVCGKPIPAARVKELPPLRGVGMEGPDEYGSYFATTDGKVAFRDGKLEIRSVHEVMGDVDYITGKIVFYGDIMINGNVGSDVVIRAGKTVTINGTVEGAQIQAGQDIILKRGIQGNDKAKIVCGGSLYTDFIEQTTVEAAGNVNANSIMNSRVTAQGKVLLTGKRGTVIGGVTYGLLGIDAVCAGNSAEIRTILQVGAKAEHFAQLQDLKKEKDQLTKDYGAQEEELRPLVKQKALTGGSPMQEMRLKLLTEKMSEIDDRRQKVSGKMKELEDLIQKARTSRVTIDGNVCRGVCISANNAQFAVPNNTCYMKYENVEGQIIGSVIPKT